LSDKFPLVLTTRLEDAYKLTGFKHLESGKKLKPEPTLEMHPDTVASLSLIEGDWVEIETVNGR